MAGCAAASCGPQRGWSSELIRDREPTCFAHGEDRPGSGFAVLYRGLVPEHCYIRRHAASARSRILSSAPGDCCAKLRKPHRMKIAIVAPSQVPYVQGGAERLWRGLHHALESAGHLCELFNVPTPDGDFWEIIDGYRKFSELNYDHFDVVVTGKNPAWMISHPNHYVYML